MKKQTGITLIALVITIIVLLILAGVAIATLTGDNGILTKTADAKKVTLQGEEKEQIRLGYLDYQLASSMRQGENLSVEGAEVIKNLDNTWTITFTNTRNVYTLSADGGTITEQPSVQTFNFTIADDYNSNPITYTAEVGMTWQQWVSNSNYNTDGFIIEDGFILKSDKSRAVFRQLQVYNDLRPATSEEVIQMNFTKCQWGVDWGISSSTSEPSKPSKP